MHLSIQCQSPDEVLDYSFNWARETFAFRSPGTQYDLASRVRPTLANGYEYECTQAGQTDQPSDDGDGEPMWPTVLGATVADGSVVWTCVAISLAGLRKTISSSTWSAEAASMIIDDSAFTARAGEQITSVKLSGGTDGLVSDVVNHVTFSDGTEVDAIIRVAIEDQAD